MPKVNCKEASVCAGRTVAIAGAEIVVIGQDDGFMRRGVHPPIHGVLRIVIGTRTGVNDLSAPPAGITRRNLPAPIRGSIRAVVRQEIIGCLVIAVDSGRVLEGIGIRQRPQACQGPLVVNEG